MCRCGSFLHFAYIIGGADVNVLKDTLGWLRSREKGMNYDYSCEELLKTGLIYEIICTIYRLLPYYCNGCENIVDHLEGLETQRCIACKIGGCPTCHDGATNRVKSLCPQCCNEISKGRRIPNSFIRIKSWKRMTNLRRIIR